MLRVPSFSCCCFVFFMSLGEEQHLAVVAYDSCGLLQSPSPSLSSSPFDSYRSSAKIGASLTCYCTALLSAFELFAHESVDLLTRPQYPNPLRTLPPPLPFTLPRHAMAWFPSSSSSFVYIFYFIFCAVCCLCCLRLRVPSFSWQDATNTVQQVLIFAHGR